MFLRCLKKSESLEKPVAFARPARKRATCIACPLCYNAAGVIQTVTRRVVNRNPPTKIEKGETPEQAAARELMEETGHWAASFKYLGCYHPSNGSSNQVFHVFVARGVTRVGAIQDTNEVSGLRWFAPAEVRALIARNEIRDGLSLTSLSWAMMLGEL